MNWRVLLMMAVVALFIAFFLGVRESAEAVAVAHINQSLSPAEEIMASREMRAGGGNTGSVVAVLFGVLIFGFGSVVLLNALRPVLKDVRLMHRQAQRSGGQRRPSAQQQPIILSAPPTQAPPRNYLQGGDQWTNEQHTH